MNRFPVIQVQQLQVQQYGKPILKNLNFTLLKGEHLYITGSAGTGKTTLGKALAGKIFYKGLIDTHHCTANNRTIKIIWLEDTHRWKNLTNLSNFYYQQRYNSCDATDSQTVENDLWQHAQQHAIANSEELYVKYCQIFQLAHRLQTPLIQLSNGEQKKLQIIKAFVQQPDILITDNINTGLDNVAQQNVSNILKQLSENGTTLLYISSNRQPPSFISHVLTLKQEGAYTYTNKLCYKNNMVNTSPQPRTINLNYNANNSVACSEPIIEIKNTTIQYDNKKILDNINWTVNSGEKWLIKGHNGAGKSTLLSLITGDNPQAYANNVKLFGKQRGTGESIWELKKKIGFLSPELHKYFDAALTVEDTIKSGFFDTMGVYKKLNQAQIEIANHIFEQFQLHPYTHQPFGTLSIGLQRWTLLARALIKNPPLLILDEPCQGLDENHIMQLLHTINYYVATYHTTLLYVTHIENEIPEHMDYLLQLDRGRQQIIKIKNNNIENTDEVQTTEFKNFEKV